MTALAVGIVKGNPIERILVIAPNYRFFQNWCKENGINPQAPNVRYVDNAERIRGYRDTWYIDLGVPDNGTGLNLLRTLEYMKAANGLKSAWVTDGGNTP